MQEHRVGNLSPKAQGPVSQDEVWNLRETAASNRVERRELDIVLADNLADGLALSVLHTAILAGTRRGLGVIPYPTGGLSPGSSLKSRARSPAERRGNNRCNPLSSTFVSRDR